MSNHSRFLNIIRIWLDGLKRVINPVCFSKFWRPLDTRLIMYLGWHCLEKVLRTSFIYETELSSAKSYPGHSSALWIEDSNFLIKGQEISKTELIHYTNRPMSPSITISRSLINLCRETRLQHHAKNNSKARGSLHFLCSNSPYLISEVHEFVLCAKRNCVGLSR